MVTRRVTSRVTAPTARRVTGDGVSAGSGETPSAPTISDQPDSIEVYETQTAQFSVTATSTGLSYQWQKSDNSGVDWADIGGATSATYTTPSTLRSTDNNDQYRCVVTNAGGSVTSDAATLTVWNPSQLTSLALWLDGNDAATILNSVAPDVAATDGQTIRRWVDKSGNARHAEQATGVSQPLVNYDNLNSRPTVDFDGTNDFLVTAGTAADWKFLHDGTDCVFFAVWRPGLTSNPNSAHPLLDTGGLSTPGIGYLFRYDDRSSISRLDAVNSQATRGASGTTAFSLLSNNKITPNVFSVFENRIDADNATASQRTVVRINGTETTGNVSTNAPSTANPLRSLNIGRMSNEGGTPIDHMAGCIAELIICSAANTSNLAKVRAYISAKWDLSPS